MRGDVLTLAPSGLVLRGTLEKFSVPPPAAGANFARVTGQGYVERIRSLTFQLVTSAVVANRVVTIEYQDADTNRWGMVALADVQAASTTAVYGFGIGDSGGVRAGLTRYSYPLLDVYLYPGDRIASAIQLVDVGDQVSAIRGLVERYSLGPDGYPLGEEQPADTTRARRYAAGLEGE